MLNHIFSEGNRKKILIIMMIIVCIVFLFNFILPYFSSPPQKYSVEETTRIIGMLKSCRKSDTLQEDQLDKCSKIIGLSLKNAERLDILFPNEFKKYLMTLFKKIDVNKKNIKDKNQVENFTLFALVSSLEDSSWNNWTSMESSTTKKQLEEKRNQQESQQYGVVRIFLLILFVSFCVFFSNAVKNDIHKLIRIRFKLEYVGIKLYSKIINELIFIKKNKENNSKNKKSTVDKNDSTNDPKESHNEYLKIKLIESEDDLNMIYTAYRFLQVNKDIPDEDKKQVESELENKKKQYIQKINDLLK